jgi:ATP-dependent RNA helicase RhlE
MRPEGIGSHILFMSNKPNEQASFYGLNISPSLLKRLDDLKFKVPTPIQEKAIPAAIRGEDLIGIAQTGTGKTLAFAIPMLQHIMASNGKGLVILPTRELAIQVEEVFQKVGQPFGIRTAVLIGGASMDRQVRDVRNRPNVIVATPGRLQDHIQQRTISLQDVNILVLDEADRMLDMGFEPQIKRILTTLPIKRQTMLFSATMPERITQIARNYMKAPVRVEVAPAGTAAERVDQEVFFVPKVDKIRLLQQVLAEYHGTVLVFSRTKHGAKKINRVVKHMGHTAAEIHSDRSLAQRREALEGFKRGKYRVLIATDIAARGIDVTGIEVVINYDLPDQAEDYVHRIGRTGRAGLKGRAISFAMPEQKRDVRAIEMLMRTRLLIKPLPELPIMTITMEPDRAQDSYGYKNRGGQSRGGQGGGQSRGQSRSYGQSRGQGQSQGRSQSQGQGYSSGSPQAPVSSPAQNYTPNQGPARHESGSQKRRRRSVQRPGYGRPVKQNPV